MKGSNWNGAGRYLLSRPTDLWPLHFFRTGLFHVPMESPHSKNPVCLQYSYIIPQYLLQRFIDIRHAAIAVLKDDYLIDTSLTWNNRLCHDDITSSCLLAYKTALKVGIWNHSCQFKESNTLHLYFFPVSFFKTDFRWFTRLTAVGKLLQVCTYES